MNASNVLVLDISAIKSEFPDDWVRANHVKCAWFLGQSFETLNTLKLPHGITVQGMGGDINRIAGEIAGEIENLDEQVFRGPWRRVWDASDLAERNPYTSSLYFDSCRTLALLQKAQENDTTLVIVDQADDARVFAQVCRDNGVAVQMQLGPDTGAIERRGLRRLVDEFRKARTFVSEMKTLRNLRNKTAGVDWKRVRESDVVVALWARSNTFPLDAPLEEHSHFGLFPHMLNEWGVKVAYLAFPISWVEPFEEIAENGVHAHDPVVFLHDFLNPFDVVIAMVKALLFPLVARRQLVVKGIDLKAVITRAIQRDTGSWRLARALLFGGVGVKMKAAKIKPRNVVHLYENQPWEKCLRAGIQRNLAETKTVACQQSFFADRYLSVLPAANDIRLGRIPDTLLVLGAEFSDKLKASGVADKQVKISGGLRYDLKTSPDNKGVANEPPSSPLRVLVSGSIGLDETLEIAIKAALAADGLDGVRFTINFHPVMAESSRKQIERAVQAVLGADADFIFSDQPAAPLLADADAVLYNSSGVVFEAMGVGVAPIFIGSDCMLDLNKAPTDTIYSVRSPEEIRELLSTLASGGQAQDIEPYGDTLKRVISPRNDAIFCQTLGV